MGNFISHVFAPQLYYCYHYDPPVYSANAFEEIGDLCLGYLFPMGLILSLCGREPQYALYLGIFLAFCLTLRGIGRMSNPTYEIFFQIWERAVADPEFQNIDALRRYDFAFWGWPVGFRSFRVAIEHGVNNWLGSIIGWPIAHSVGIYCLYPGVIMSYWNQCVLRRRRARLVMEEGGMRNKIMSSDGCEIDTIFLDRRGVKKTRVGRFLVLCLEGNQSYYEWGMNRTAIQAGYSVLGFNRPGFGESTGHPFPKFELNAAEAIMQYCQEVLGFDDNHIIIYAWSIGGFPGSYLSGQYPNIRGLIIDGSFEDVLPVVLNFVPRCLSILVRIMIRSQFDLRSSLELVRYHRPIRIFRRTRDAIMAHPPGEIATNRANMLLADVLLQRHPILMNNALAFAALTEWLSVPHIRGPAAIRAMELEQLNIPADPTNLTNQAKANLIIRLAERILTDLDATHNTLIPVDLFLRPWTA